MNYLGDEKFMVGFNPDATEKAGNIPEGYTSCGDMVLTDKYLFASLYRVVEGHHFMQVLSVNKLDDGQQYYLSQQDAGQKRKFSPINTIMKYVDNHQFISDCTELQCNHACRLLESANDTLCAEYALYKQMAGNQNHVLMIATMK